MGGWRWGEETGLLWGGFRPWKAEAEQEHERYQNRPTSVMPRFGRSKKTNVAASYSRLHETEQQPPHRFFPPLVLVSASNSVRVYGFGLENSWHAKEQTLDELE